MYFPDAANTVKPTVDRTNILIYAVLNYLLLFGIIWRFFFSLFVPSSWFVGELLECHSTVITFKMNKVYYSPKINTISLLLWWSESIYLDPATSKKGSLSLYRNRRFAGWLFSSDIKQIKHLLLVHPCNQNKTSLSTWKYYLHFYTVGKSSVYF